ncbi:MAG: hypothetical protein U9N82_10965 [Thermodesulfobacteriota bacterium]|nr:hypothetical protein [Thermodesulfobacteriota bacterium]
MIRKTKKIVLKHTVPTSTGTQEPDCALCVKPTQTKIMEINVR